MKKYFSAAVAAMLSLGMICTPSFAEEADPLSFADAAVTELTVKLDGEDFGVTCYEDVYVSNPTNVSMIPNEDGIDQKVSIYVPENANADSPIIFYVNNAGWFMDAYALRRQVEDGKEYSGTADNDEIGKGLASGYVLVSYGCRSRNDNPTEEGKYVNHSPATMVDTKAVIRYLRYNKDLLPAGNTDRIVITGTSGGGALSTIISSSGNSADYFEGLYEIGAAGIEQGEDGYVSTIGDDIFATIAYCPINDLREGSEAYEWTYQETRQRLLSEGREDAFQDPLTEEYTGDDMLAASAELAADYAAYVDGLGLKRADGSDLTSENLKDAILELLNAGFADAAERFGAEKMQDDLAGNALYSGESVTAPYNTGSEDWADFLDFEAEVPVLSDYDQYLYFVARNQALKVAPAFSNVGLGIAQQNEDSLYGSEDAAYEPFTRYSWDNDKAENGYGLDETGLSWEEYLATEDGQRLSMQLQMSSPIPYLTTENGDSAPYWYVRHGLRDRDTSFALQTVLYTAIMNDDSIKGVNFLLPWLQPHSGDYDVQEAYAWLESVLAEATVADVDKAAEENARQAAEGNLSIEEITHNALMGMMSNLGSVANGFDVAAWVDGEPGQWAANNFKYFFGGVDQNAPEIYEKWEALGATKLFFPADDELQEWSMFIPANLEEGKEYPAMFAMHMGGTNILFAEGMGFVEDGISQGYIVICPSWNGHDISEAQQAAFEASGFENYEAYAFAKVLERALEAAPIDASRVYAAGFSGGGNAAAKIAMECPELVAGVSPATGAAVQISGEAALQKMAENGIALMMCYGTMDAEQRWPITKDPVELGKESTYVSIEDRIANVNAWNTLSGSAAAPVTPEDVAELAQAEEVSASSLFGLNFDETSSKEYETTYYFGDFKNAEGQPAVRYMAVEGNPHFVSPMWATEVFDFFKHFSRDLETGALVYTE